MEYPNPEEEFDLLYADELEAMEDFGDPTDDRSSKKSSKKSLNFDTEKVVRAASPSFDVDLMELDDLLAQPPSKKPEVKKTSDTAKQPASFEINLDELDALMSEPSAPVSSGVDRPSSPPLAEQPPKQSSALSDIQNALNKSDTRKRKANELFGNIDDIGSDEEYFDTAEFGTKRKLVDEDADMKLIERIRAERSKLLLQSSSAKIGTGQDNRKEEDYFSVRVPRYPFVTMRNFNYNKFFLRLRSDEYIQNRISEVKVNKSGLLISSKQTWSEANSILEEKRMILEIKRKLDALDEGSWAGEAKEENTSLWVEKYSPKRYLDLLSDEGTNKTLLKWLKLWDEVVFNKKRPVKAKVATPKNDKWKGKDGLFQKKGKNFANVLNEEFDEYGRPMQKIALLAGPPGLGKTTLAHIVAKHAGYNPVEVNASDDSNPESFRLQLEAATEMKSVLGDNPKPNCLILDEIDGSMATAVDVLLQYISDKATGKKKRGAKPKILKRPIICICNDLYTPVLRNLRQVALIINFPQTQSARLAQRLMYIATKEMMKTDFGALLLLCDKTNNDIRSCLSFLHFYKSKGKGVHLLDVQQANVGQKDTRKGLFAVWNDIFQIIKSKNVGLRQVAGRADGGVMSLTSRMGRVLKTVQSYGDYERLCTGVFENYLHMKMRDTRFQGVAVGTEWFCYFDQINTTLKESQSYVLMPYMPYCFAMWHFLFAGISYPTIHYPHSTYEMSVKTTHNQMTLHAILHGMNPHTRSGTKAVEILLDLFPLLLHVIKPSLKNVNAHLLTEYEKEELKRVINIFLEYGLGYVQERTAEGDMIFRMEPNLPELVQFPNVPNATTATYAVKQLIAHEADAEKIRRINGVWSDSVSGKTALDDGEPSPSRNKSLPKEVLPNHLQSLSPQILKPQKQKLGLKNWLSITKKASVVAREKAAETAAENSLHEISFLYKEGYSNAVRKKVTIADLL